jgi:hypothetical protein
MLVLAMLLVASVAFAQQTPAGQGPTDLNGGLTSTPGGFTGSGPNDTFGPGLGRHDLKDNINGNVLGCETCHLPHTSPSFGTSFMWAWRNVPTSLPTYVTAINNGALVTPTGINGNSRSMLCFSCHDGTSASANGITSGVTFNGTPYPLVNTSGGTSNGLKTEHPVDAIIPTTSDYTVVAVGTTFGSGSTATIGVLGSLPLWDAQYHVECDTCHDVHNDYTTNGPAPAGGIPFLREANTNGVALCRECHAAQ